jgi:hypothetical protein
LVRRVVVQLQTGVMTRTCLFERGRGRLRDEIENEVRRKRITLDGGA